MPSLVPTGVSRCSPWISGRRCGACSSRPSSRRRTPTSRPSRSTSSERLAPLSSGVLLDADYGVGPVRAAGALPEGVGLLVAAEPVEKDQWNGEPRARVDPERGAAYVLANGGDALKFLVQWRPGRPHRSGDPDLASEALTVVGNVVADCAPGRHPQRDRAAHRQAPGRVAALARGHRRARDRVGDADGGRAARPPQARVARQRRGLPPRHAMRSVPCPGRCSRPVSGSTTSSSACASRSTTVRRDSSPVGRSGARRSNSPAPSRVDFLEQTAVPRLATPVRPACRARPLVARSRGMRTRRRRGRGPPEGSNTTRSASQPRDPFKAIKPNKGPQ